MIIYYITELCNNHIIVNIYNLKTPSMMWSHLHLFIYYHFFAEMIVVDLRLGI